MMAKVIEQDGRRYLEDPEEGLLEIKYGLPGEVEFFANCVISNQRPSSAVEFTHAGKQKGDDPIYRRHMRCVPLCRAKGALCRLGRAGS